MNKLTRLTKRLRFVYSMIPKVKTMADIGTDHGYLAVAAVNGNKAEHVIAGDVNKGPLEAAKEYVKSKKLEDKIDCRLGNGLQVLNGDKVDLVTICGMGGRLMVDILEGTEFKPETLVLQPQGGRKELKKTLMERGYGLVDEKLVEDMGHIYDVWIWKLKTDENINELSDIYVNLPEDDVRWEVGVLTCENKEPLLKPWFEKLMSIEQDILDSVKTLSKEHPKYKEHYDKLKKVEAGYETYC